MIFYTDPIMIGLIIFGVVCIIVSILALIEVMKK